MIRYTITIYILLLSVARGVPNHTDLHDNEIHVEVEAPLSDQEGSNITVTLVEPTVFENVTLTEPPCPSQTVEPNNPGFQKTNNGPDLKPTQLLYILLPNVLYAVKKNF